MILKIFQLNNLMKHLAFFTENAANFEKNIPTLLFTKKGQILKQIGPKRRK
jgi:hypothetical protein